MRRRVVLLSVLAVLVVVGALVVFPRSTAAPHTLASATATVASTTTPPTAPATTTTTRAKSTTTNTTRAGAAATTSTTIATTTPATRPPSNSGGKVVVIDPGHNGADGAHTAEINRLVPAGGFMKACDTTGAQTNAGYTEAAFNFDVAQRLAADLRQRGVTVVMTRTTNDGWGPCINQRAAIGNQARADAAISIHADGGPPGGRGFHVIQPALVRGYTDSIVAPSHRLALDVLAGFPAGTGMPPSTYIGTAGLDTRAELGGLNLSQVPKVFVECGNMRNATDAALFSSPTFRQKVADALAAALATYLST